MSFIINPYRHTTAASNGLLTGLESYWKLDEASGTLADSHGSKDSVTESNITYSATGIINNAIDYESTNSSYTYFGQFTGYGSSARSVSAWVNLESVTVVRQRLVHFASSTTLAGGPAASLYVNTSGQWEAAVGGTPFDGIITGSSAGTGSFVHLVLTYDSSDNMEFYVDGVSQGTVSGVTGSSPADPYLYIGCYNPTIGQFTDGIIDEVGIWSRELSSGDVTTLNNGGSALSYYNFTS